MRPVCLIIRDGWGYCENEEGNAVLAANTPNIDWFLSKYPHTLLKCSGEAVGLPSGYQGSSEVGHLNMGAGRIVIQELKRIDDELSSGDLFENEKWKIFIKKWHQGSGSLHFIGLLQDEGVHAHQEHLFKLMHKARADNPEGKIIIHPFLDGRDTPPRSCLEYLVKMQSVMAEVGNCTFGTLMGRYYAMDRSQDWELTDQAFACLVAGEGRKVYDPLEAVKQSYSSDLTPDQVAMFDEYIPPMVLDDYTGIKDGDCVFHFNYRQDRAIQLTLAFVATDYAGKRQSLPKIDYLGFTRYYDDFEKFLMSPMDSGGGMNTLLGEVISRAGLTQLRIAETQKFRHVTCFFNGKSTTPYDLEKQVCVPGRFEPATFASHPEMEAYKVTEKVLKELTANDYAFIVINYANGDMVGHTGDFEAAKKAIEVVDECVGNLVESLLDLNAHILLTADHGNAEQMIDYKTKMIKTSHTLNPVELIYVANDSQSKRLLPDGKLSDLAPTILNLLGLPVPPEMTATNLVAGSCCAGKCKSGTCCDK